MPKLDGAEDQLTQVAQMFEPTVNDLGAASRAHRPWMSRLDTGWNEASGKPHRNLPERGALLKAFRVRFEASGNRMIYARCEAQVGSFLRLRTGTYRLLSLVRIGKVNHL